jgi:hypothetical protein
MRIVFMGSNHIMRAGWGPVSLTSRLVSTGVDPSVAPVEATPTFTTDADPNRGPGNGFCGRAYGPLPP